MRTVRKVLAITVTLLVLRAAAALGHTPTSACVPVAQGLDGSLNNNDSKGIDGFFALLPVAAPAQQSKFFSAVPLGPTPTPPPVVYLPSDIFKTAAPLPTLFIEPVVVSYVDPGLGYVSFACDFTYDSAVVTFDSTPVQAAGIAAAWTVTGTVISSGPGSIKTLHVTGSGPTLTGTGDPLDALFQLRMLRVSSTQGDISPLAWSPAPNNFRFMNAAQGAHAPFQHNGAFTIDLRLTLPSGTIATSVPATSVVIFPVSMRTPIHPSHNYMGFQGDFTFAANVVNFDSLQVTAGGLTATNWNVSANVLGVGTIRTLRVSAFSQDFTPLNGCGTLFNLRMKRNTTVGGSNCPLIWQPTSPDQFIFLDGNLNQFFPLQDNGSLRVVTSAGGNPTPTPTATPALPNCTPFDTSTPPPVLDHFKAYVTDGPPPDSTNGFDQVLLQDQWDTAGPVPKQVGELVRFANPVQKTLLSQITPVTNPDTHMTFYQLLPPEPGTTRQVDIGNQFGYQTILTQDAVLLGVPTQKQPFGLAHDMDHFKFYNATGFSISASVNLVDQFYQELNVQVGQPRYFGNPVKKTHNDIDGISHVVPINHPDDVLVCYDISPQTFTSGVTIVNQFTNPTQPIPIEPADLLCVPSSLFGGPCPNCTPPPPSPTPPPPTPTPTPTPTPMINIAGNVSYCSSLHVGPVPNVSLTLTGDATTSTITDSSGNYVFSSLVSGGSYDVTPTKSALPPGSMGIDNVDVTAVHRHFLNIILLPAGCRRAAGDVNGDNVINTMDVIAIQRFYLGLSIGIANTGKYQFTPAVRSYLGAVTDQTNQNYSTLILGDVASPFAGGP